MCNKWDSAHTGARGGRRREVIPSAGMTSHALPCCTWVLVHELAHVSGAPERWSDTLVAAWRHALVLPRGELLPTVPLRLAHLLAHPKSDLSHDMLQ